MNNNKSMWIMLASITISITNLIILLIALKKGYKSIDIPDYKVYVDVPMILDVDENVVIKDFSLVKINDGKIHLCYELNTDHGINYYDASTKKTIDSNTIDSILKLEDEVNSQTPTFAGEYKDVDSLNKVIGATFEEHHVKMLERK